MLRSPTLALALAGTLAACGDATSDTPPSSMDAGASAPDMGSGPVDMGVPDMGVEPECTNNDECSGATPYC